MTNLEKLKADKEKLKAEVQELQELISFKNPKESFREITHGFSEKVNPLKNESIGLSSLGLNKNLLTSFISDNVIRLGSAALVNRIGKKTIKSKSWKYKILGLILVYVAPIVIKKIGEKLDDFQKRETTKGMSKLI